MQRNNKTRFLAGAALCAAVSSHAVTVVSGASPYASCANIGPGQTNYLNAEVEPYLAVNPNNLTNFIGVWQQDRWSDGGARGLAGAYSNDSGHTWSPTQLPFSACATGGLNYERASDPWISIGPDGTAYAVSISFNASNNNNGVGAAVSTDGGATWNHTQLIIANNEPTTQFFNDKESVTAHPTIVGTAYAVWDRLESPNGNPYANRHTAAFRGPAMFSKTADGGKTWSAPKVIVNTPSRQQTLGNQIVVDPNPQRHTLYNFFTFFTPPFNVTASKVAFVKSTDDGATWTKPQIIADLRSVGVINPNVPTEGVRTGDDIPEAAIDAATGQLYVVWQDSRFNGGHYDEVALSTSSDFGKTWSAPIRVNTPTPGRPAFTPSVRVNSAGTVGVTYYDFRNLGSTNMTTLPTDYWKTTSTNAGASFGNEARLTPEGSFDMKKAPNAEGLFVGDYEGLAARGTDFVPFFVKTTNTVGNPTDVFVVAP